MGTVGCKITMEQFKRVGEYVLSKLLFKFMIFIIIPQYLNSNVNIINS